MKNSIRKGLFFSLLISLVACKSNNEKAPEVVVETASENGNVTYIVANNYFVKNNATPVSGKINTQEEFDAIFGAAAVMGENGKPTEINFNNQFVVAVIGNETNIATSIVPVSLIQSEEGLMFTYRTDKGVEQSYTMVPYTMIVVDRKFDEVVYIQELE